MDTLTERIELLSRRTMVNISSAAEKQDVSALEGLTTQAGELKRLKEQVVAIEARVELLESGHNGPANPTKQIANAGRREFVIEVSQGMINQNLLTLTDQVNRGAIRLGEILTVETIPDGDRFKTELLAPGNKLQERGAIARFYRSAHVQAGERVMLVETTPGQWQLKKADMVRYKRI